MAVTDSSGKTRPLRAVLLGAGMIAALHRRASQLAGGEIVGIMDATPERSREAAERWATQPVTSPDDLSSLAPDIVHVCTPNGFHSDHVEAAIASGAHVVCEKPLAVGRDASERLLELARQHDRVATIPFVYRFHPLVREIRSRAAAGEFGRWQLLHGSYLQDWLLPPTATSWCVDAAQGGPSRVFADIGSHWCDLMEFTTGERIASVMAAMTITVQERPAVSQATFGGGVGGGPTIAVDTEDAATVMCSGPAPGCWARSSSRRCPLAGKTVCGSNLTRMSDLAEYDLVGLQDGSSLQDKHVSEAQKMNLPLKLKVKVLSFDGVRCMVEARMGLAVLPEGAITPYLNAGRISAVALDELWATRSLLLACRDYQDLSVATRTLLACLAPNADAPIAA